MKVTVRAVIPHPPDVVFDFVADMRNDPQWAPLVQDVQQVQGEGPGVGAVWSFRQKMGKRWFPAETEMSTYERPTRLAWQADHKAMEYRSEMRFEPHRRGTQVIQTNVEVFHGVPWIVRPLLPFVVRRALRRQLRLLKKALQE